MILIGSEIILPEGTQARRLEPCEYYDEAILGYDSTEDRFIYDENKIIDILIIKEEMSVEDAIEWYDYNIYGTQGKNYPIYIIPMR
jgi:hypothetical protein